MEPKELLNILSVAKKLKCNTRHSYTSSGRKESVTEHSWRLSLMATLISGSSFFVKKYAVFRAVYSVVN